MTGPSASEVLAMAALVIETELALDTAIEATRTKETKKTLAAYRRASELRRGALIDLKAVGLPHANALAAAAQQNQDAAAERDRLAEELRQLREDMDGDLLAQRDAYRNLVAVLRAEAETALLSHHNRLLFGGHVLRRIDSQLLCEGLPAIADVRTAQTDEGP